MSQQADLAMAELAYADTLGDFAAKELAVKTAEVHALLDIASALRGEIA